MSIEQHYEKLRREAATRRSWVELVTGLAAGENRSLIRGTGLWQQVVEELNRQAVELWPTDRAAIAAAGGEMPDGPMRFGGSGIGIAGLVTAYSDRHLLDYELDTATRVVRAAQALLPKLTREAEAAEAAFESYRQAVAQGVAVPPSDD